MCYTQICPRFECRDEHTIHTCVYCVLTLNAGAGRGVCMCVCGLPSRYITSTFAQCPACFKFMHESFRLIITRSTWEASNTEFHFIYGTGMELQGLIWQNIKGTSYDFIFHISNFTLFHTYWFLFFFFFFFCSLETPPVYQTYPPKQSCRNDTFGAREPNICSLNWFFSRHKLISRSANLDF